MTFDLSHIPPQFCSPNHARNVALKAAAKALREAYPGATSFRVFRQAHVASSLALKDIDALDDSTGWYAPDAGVDMAAGDLLVLDNGMDAPVFELIDPALPSHRCLIGLDNDLPPNYTVLRRTRTV